MKKSSSFTVLEWFSAVGLPPKAVCLVFQTSVCPYMVEALVGSGTVQRSKLCPIGTEFDVMESGSIEIFRKCISSGIPRGLDFRIPASRFAGQQGYGVGIGVSAHEAQTCDFMAVFVHQFGYGFCRQETACIAHQIGTVASRATNGASRQVQCQRHLIGYLAEYNVVIYVFKHVTGCLW